MVETQSTSNVNPEAVKAATARVEQKAREMYDVLVDASVKWATYSLEAGRNALTTSARALDRAAEALAGVETKLKKTHETPADEATEPPAAAPAADPTAN